MPKDSPYSEFGKQCNSMSNDELVELRNRLIKQREKGEIEWNEYFIKTKIIGTYLA